ncbi:MAG: CpaD family pilus assembly protein [Pseudomonadota bacterium]
MKNTLTKFSVVSSLALAAACASPFNGPQHALTTAEEHPIAVDSQIVTLTIDADATTTELSGRDKARLRAFAHAYLTNGHGPLTITAPSGYAGDADGQEAAADIRSALYEAGVSWDSLAGATYRTGGDNGDQLIVSYTHYVATPSECGVWNGITNRDYRNLRSPNFGCATQNNLAAVIADPKDLVEASALTARDTPASVRAFEAYREGSITSSDAEDIDAGLAN